MGEFAVLRSLFPVFANNIYKYGYQDLPSALGVLIDVQSILNIQNHLEKEPFIRKRPIKFVQWDMLELSHLTEF